MAIRHGYSAFQDIIINYISIIIFRVLGDASFCLLHVWIRKIGIFFYLFIRYESAIAREKVHSYIVDLLKYQLSHRQLVDHTTRNLLRLMSAACGISDVRLLASQRLETWLQNPKVTVCNFLCRLLKDWRLLNIKDCKTLVKLKYLIQK